MCTKNGSYCEKEKVRGGGGQGRCERRSEAFVKIQKKNIFFFIIFFFFFFGGGGGGSDWGDQGGCEWRSEGFVKIQKKNLGGRGGGGLGGPEKSIIKSLVFTAKLFSHYSQYLQLIIALLKPQRQYFSRQGSKFNNVPF